MTASRQMLQSMLDQLDALQVVEPIAHPDRGHGGGGATAEPGSALLAASVLMDSAVEHYRGSFTNRRCTRRC